MKLIGAHRNGRKQKPGNVFMRDLLRELDGVRVLDFLNPDSDTCDIHPCEAEPVARLGTHNLCEAHKAQVESEIK